MRPPTISEIPTGRDGVSLYTLANDNEMVVEIFNHGGIIHSISFPDHRGLVAGITLGFPSLQDYMAYNPAPHAGLSSGAGVYFGALVGRYANRIAHGALSLGGTSYQVPVNNGVNALHGGTIGFDQKIWVPETSSGPESVSLQLTYVSVEGEMGFPGQLTTVATYTLDNENRLVLTFRATTTADTVVNLTNHTYWNLAGEAAGTVHDQILYLNADGFTPVDATLIPTGKIEPVTGTPFDFTRPTAIGENLGGGPRFSDSDNKQLLRCRGYDHNWVLNQTRPASLILAARAFDPSSRRELSIFTTEPGIQFYSGNFPGGTLKGTSGRSYPQNAGFALETQHFPDSPNRAEFPSTVLRPGESFSQTTVYGLAVR